MSKLKMDAVEVASIIHKGDFSKLSGKSFEMCDNLGMGKKYTLNQLGMTVDKLAKIVNDGFSELRQDIKDINVRLDRVENRLDLVEKRLDYYGLKIENIEKRLDYNGLKQLPNNK